MVGRLLFVGDFSGLSFFLSRGVAACGTEVVLYSNGDGWKGIPRIKQLYDTSGNSMSRAWKQIKGFQRLLCEIDSSDTLVLATEFIFNRWLDAAFLDALMGKAGRTILLHAGCNDAFHKTNKIKLLCKNCKQFDLKSNGCVFESSRWPGLASIIRRVDRVVPFTSVYGESAKYLGVSAENITKYIHFPIDFGFLQEIPVDAQQQGIIHGVNREGFKGTVHLRKLIDASEVLRPLIEILPRMRFYDFIGRIKTSDVVIDQLFANGYGMTGALSLAVGTRVLFGYTDSAPPSDFSGLGCLTVRITGNIKIDVTALEETLTNHFSSPIDKEEIIKAAKMRHDHVNVAKNFLAEIL